MTTYPDPLLETTAAGIVGDSIWALLERHGLTGLPLSRVKRPHNDVNHIRVELNSGHTVWVVCAPEEPDKNVRYSPRHRKLR